jgi:hypothetical protein
MNVGQELRVVTGDAVEITFATNCPPPSLHPLAPHGATHPPAARSAIDDTIVTDVVTIISSV